MTIREDSGCMLRGDTAVDADLIIVMVSASLTTGAGPVLAIGNCAVDWQAVSNEITPRHTT